MTENLLEKHPEKSLERKEQQKHKYDKSHIKICTYIMKY